MDGWLVIRIVYYFLCVCGVNLSLFKPLPSLFLLNLSFSVTDPPPTNEPSDRARRTDQEKEKEKRKRLTEKDRERESMGSKPYR